MARRRFNEQLFHQMKSSTLLQEYQELVQILKRRGFELRKVDGNPSSSGNELPEMNLWACHFKA